jgi:hypothetical protein
MSRAGRRPPPTYLHLYLARQSALRISIPSPSPGRLITFQNGRSLAYLGDIRGQALGMALLHQLLGPAAAAAGGNGGQKGQNLQEDMLMAVAMGKVRIGRAMR